MAQPEAPLSNKNPKGDRDLPFAFRVHYNQPTRSNYLLSPYFSISSFQ